MNQPTEKIPVNEASLFDRLAFCWESFENDGANTSTVSHLQHSIASPVLVVGSGQGLVSSAIHAIGHEVVSIDRSPEMAKFAAARRSVDTTVCDLLDFFPQQKFATIFVNTGVISPLVFPDRLHQSTRRIRELARPEATVLASCLLWTDFDAVAEQLGLGDNPDLITEIDCSILAGDSINEALDTIHGPSPELEYLKQRFHPEFATFENQIRQAGNCHREAFPEGSTPGFLASSLRYVPYGIDTAQQMEVIQSFTAHGFAFSKATCERDVVTMHFRIASSRSDTP